MARFITSRRRLPNGENLITVTAQNRKRRSEYPPGESRDSVKADSSLSFGNWARSKRVPLLQPFRRKWK